MKQLEVKHGSIYLHGNIIENLSFILTVDKEDKTTTLYKFGDNKYTPQHLANIQPMSSLVDIVSFSFGEFHEVSLPKEQQCQIVEFMVDYTLHPLTQQVGVAILENDFESLRDAFSEMITRSERNAKQEENREIHK